jgi:hypothetical protein
MTVPAPLPMVIAGCSRRKLTTASPVPALELYQGWCIPALRARAARQPTLRTRIWIISAEHGLIHADTPLLPYDRRITPDRAMALRPGAEQRLREAFTRDGVPPAVIVIAGPAYQSVLAALPSLAGAGRVHWFSTPVDGWADAEAILDRWSPPCP